jgi:hypothetical protein
LEFNVGRILNLNIDWQKKVLPLILETMTGIIKKCGVGAGSLARELRKGAIEIAFPNIGPENDFEPDALQGLGDIVRIVGRIGELGRDARILAIADDESDTLIRQRGPDPKGQYQDAQKPHSYKRKYLPHARNAIDWGLNPIFYSRALKNLGHFSRGNCYLINLTG